ncbi:hypothetical protein Bca101_068154 [Brassica carinata]
MIQALTNLNYGFANCGTLSYEREVNVIHSVLGVGGSRNGSSKIQLNFENWANRSMVLLLNLISFVINCSPAQAAKRYTNSLISLFLGR